MCARVKTPPDPQAGGRILSKRGCLLGLGWEFAAPRYNGPISFFANGVHKNVGRTRVDDDSWHHVAVVHDNGTIRAYVDGRFDGSVSFGRPVGPNSNALWVGCASGRRGFDTFHRAGEFKDVKCFNRELTDFELMAQSLNCKHSSNYVASFL